MMNGKIAEEVMKQFVGLIKNVKNKKCYAH